MSASTHGNGGWIGVDLDGTLAVYPHNFPEIGPPIPAMLLRVRAWLAEGKDVRIVTARVAVVPDLANDEGQPADEAFATDQHAKITAWCVAHLGRALPVTAMKDFCLIELWDDRCVQVLTNQGVPLADLIDWAKVVGVDAR